ncbi:hypothetical protein LEP3755_67240 (plasmid) [Leptolyngbya sp. NIES-3755]|nr:hypothetical protein LEP3755_67240 [Leptolyngbya sp. NIES-3755]
MEFKLSEARVRELARIEAEAGCEVQAGDGWDHELAQSVVDGKSTTKTSALSFVIYCDEFDQYRWRCTVADGKVIAESASGYTNKADCEAEIRWFRGAISSSQIVA